MSLLQPILGSGGVIQYSYYGQFDCNSSAGCEGPAFSADEVAANLAAMREVGLELQSLATRLFLRPTRTPLACDSPFVHAATFEDAGSGAKTLLAVNGAGTPGRVNCSGLGLGLAVGAWGVAIVDLDGAGPSQTA